VREDDRIDLIGLGKLAPGKPVTMVLNHKDGTKEELVLEHTFTDEQISWFKAGSALNKIKSGGR
jgi:aconitate hydratase